MQADGEVVFRQQVLLKNFYQTFPLLTKFMHSLDGAQQTYTWAV